MIKIDAEFEGWLAITQLKVNQSIFFSRLEMCFFTAYALFILILFKLKTEAETPTEKYKVKIKILAYSLSAATLDAK